MKNKQAIVDLIVTQGLLPLYFHADPDKSEQVLRALYAAGIRAVEYTNRGEAALENFKLLRKTRDKDLPGLYLGIGTIKNRKEAKAYIKAGADYIVCPGIIEEVAETVHKEEMLWVPGCMSTTEIIRAEEAGATLVKLFPGSLLGPSFVSAIKELFPGLLFMPTGGVDTTRENLQSWFASGVVAVGMGSKLISKNVLENAQYAQLTQETRSVLELIKTIKG